MALVNLNPGESIESALRRFKRKVMTEEIIKDLKKHQHFIPPGQKAKLKSANARKRNRRKGRPRMMNNQQGGFNQNNQQGGFGQGQQQQGGFQRPQGGFNRE
ncbi:MAG TPA: 30S ribosomal protein S21 [Pyrinomonadaceae bacterium]|jgi:small subunit ribosomal protein S21